MVLAAFVPHQPWVGPNDTRIDFNEIWQGILEGLEVRERQSLVQLLEQIQLQRRPQLVRHLEEEMRRLGGMIESFVLLSRLRGSGAIAPVKLCALNDVLLEAVGGCHAAAQRRGVTIRADAVADAEPPMVHGDAELLATMFSHVIRNCIRFSRRGDEIAPALSAAQMLIAIQRVV